MRTRHYSASMLWQEWNRCKSTTGCNTLRVVMMNTAPVPAQESVQCLALKDSKSDWCRATPRRRHASVRWLWRVNSGVLQNGPRHHSYTTDDLPLDQIISHTCISTLRCDAQKHPHRHVSGPGTCVLFVAFEDPRSNNGMNTTATIFRTSHIDARRCAHQRPVHKLSLILESPSMRTSS